MEKTRVVILGVIALIAIGFFASLINRYVLQSSAFQSNALVEFSPADGESIPEDPIRMIIKPETAGEKISAVDLTINVENGQLVAWDECTDLANSQIQFDDTRSDVQGTTGRKICGVLQGAGSLPESVVVPFTVACDGTDPVTIRLDGGSSLVTGPVQGDQYALGGATEVTYQCDGAGGGGGQPTPTPVVNADIDAKFDPSSCNVEKGESCTYNLNITSRDEANKISGFYVKMTYDKNLVKGTDISGPASVQGVQSAQLAQTVSCTTVQDCVNSPQCQATPGCSAATTKCNIPAGATSGTCVFANANVPTLTPTPGSNAPTTAPNNPAPTTGPAPTTPPTGGNANCQVANSKIDEDAGTLEMLYTCSGPAGSLPTSIENTVTLEALADGSGTLGITEIQVSGPGRTSPYAVDGNNATYNIGEGSSTGAVALDMTLRMQCVVKKPKAKDTLKVRVGLGDGPLSEPVFQTADFKVDDNGHWKGTVNFNVPPGDGYKVLPKGEYHMQKKVCDANATEDFPGAYACDKGEITLKNGTNTIDLSQIVLLTGDIPPGEQDGISNAKDQALVRNLIGKRDAESAQLADINFDGVVNAVDHACMIAALSVRYDDQ